MSERVSAGLPHDKNLILAKVDGIGVVFIAEDELIKKQIYDSKGNLVKSTVDANPETATKGQKEKMIKEDILGPDVLQVKVEEQIYKN